MILLGYMPGVWSGVVMEIWLEENARSSIIGTHQEIWPTGGKISGDSVVSRTNLVPLQLAEIIFGVDHANHSPSRYQIRA